MLACYLLSYCSECCYAVYIYRVCTYFIFVFKQKTAYEMRISDWSSDVCSSDLIAQPRRIEDVCAGPLESLQTTDRLVEVGTAPKEILAAGGQHEIPRQPPGGLRCRCDALDRKCEVENRVVAAVRVILDRAARQTG